MCGASDAKKSEDKGFVRAAFCACDGKREIRTIVKTFPQAPSLVSFPFSKILKFQWPAASKRLA